MVNINKLALGGALIGCLSLAPLLHAQINEQAVITVEVEPVTHRSLDGGNGARGCDPEITSVNDLTTTNPFARIPNVSTDDAINGIPGVIRHGDDGIGTPDEGVTARPFWAGNLPKMTDGLWSENNNDDDNSWNMAQNPLADGPAVTPRLLQWDLGEVQEVTQINVYTRHCNTRSAQIHVVYGSEAEVEPDVDIAGGDDPQLEGLGWTFIAFVDSQEAPEFLADPPATGFTNPNVFDGFTGSSVFDDAGGSLGDFRYLLFHVLSLGDQEEAYVEFDVVTTSVAPDPDVDNDGDVDGADFLAIQRDDPSLIPAWEAQYGTSNPLVAAAAVPEPGTLVLSTLAMLAWVIPGRRRRCRSKLG